MINLNCSRLYKLLGVFLFVFTYASLFCQGVFKDTVKISVQQVDSLFLKNNLLLLAEKCNIDAAKAQIIQARLFKNPTISGTQGAYNTKYQTNGGRKWFDVGNQGETSVQIQKLFLLAGKRNKQIKLAELTAGKEEQIYFDLLRTLKYSLHGSFYNAYFLQQIVKVYDKEITSLNRLIDVFQKQYDKGYISKKELLRLRSTLFSLENEKLEYSSQIITELTDLNVLMHTSNVFYIPQPGLDKVNNFSVSNLKLQELIDTAYVHRYDLKSAQSDLKLNQLNLAYQKALAIPDITLSGGWDKNGGYIHNYNFIGVQIDLPFFYRNQGNIKTAQFSVENSKYKLQSADDQVRAEVIQAYANGLKTEQLYNRFDNRFMTDLDTLNAEMIKNYEKKNISLIEFLDYYDAYKENMVQLNNLQYKRINTFEDINFNLGKELIVN